RPQVILSPGMEIELKGPRPYVGEANTAALIALPGVSARRLGEQRDLERLAIEVASVDVDLCFERGQQLRLEHDAFDVGIHNPYGHACKAARSATGNSARIEHLEDIISARHSGNSKRMRLCIPLWSAERHRGRVVLGVIQRQLNKVRGGSSPPADL